MRRQEEQDGGRVRQRDVLNAPARPLPRILMARGELMRLQGDPRLMRHFVREAMNKFRSDPNALTIQNMEEGLINRPHDS